MIPRRRKWAHFVVRNVNLQFDIFNSFIWRRHYGDVCHTIASNCIENLIDIFLRPVNICSCKVIKERVTLIFAIFLCFCFLTNRFLMKILIVIFLTIDIGSCIYCQNAFVEKSFVIDSHLASCLSAYRLDSGSTSTSCLCSTSAPNILFCCWFAITEISNWLRLHWLIQILLRIYVNFISNKKYNDQN